MRGAAWWRGLAVAALLLLLGAPLVAPAALALRPDNWPGGETGNRLALLARNTALLVGLVLLLAVPLGTGLALLLERTDLPGRSALRLALVLPLFVPLPLFVSGWESAIGPSGRWPLAVWLSGWACWAPWAQGVAPAAFLHAVAGLPWVVLIAGLGARAVERGLEEDALLLLPPWRAFVHVTVPRMTASVLAAALCVALQTAGEVTITDLMQVRTFAEEVYTQFIGPEPVAGGGDPLGRATVGALGQLLLSTALVLLLVREVGRLVPAGTSQGGLALTFPLGLWRWVLFAAVLTLTVVLVAVPTAGLVWRAGATGAPLGWSLGALVGQLGRVAQSDGGALLRQLTVCAFSGVVAAAAGLVLARWASEARWLGVVVAVVVAVAWAVPGPVLGLGLKEALRAVLDWTGWPRALSVPLWYGPSSLPVVWVYLVRYLPVAMALLWPIVRLVPRELTEAVRLEGAGPARELVWLVGPYAWTACLRAAVAVTILSLGELSAGKLVSTPGAESYAEVVWAQMHYGVGADLAARCLLLLGVVLAAMGTFAALSLSRRRQG